MKRIDKQETKRMNRLGTGIIVFALVFWFLVGIFTICKSVKLEIMKEERISFETAKLAKDKKFFGYKSNVHFRMDGSEINGLMEDWTDHNLTKEYFSAPTQSVLKKWLAKEHNLLIEIQIDQTSYPKYCFNLYKYVDFGNWYKIENPDWGLRSSEEKCLEDALLLALKQIK